MRSLPAILLATLTAVVIAVSAFVTVSHFGMRDWPTPPMPDTATRLITPTEAVSRVRERISRSDDAAGREVAAESGAGQTRRAGQHARGRASHRADRSRRGASRRGDRTGSHSGGHHSGGRDDQRNPAYGGGDSAPPATDPATPATTPAAPVTQASAGDQAQARPDDSQTPAPAQPIVPEVVVPDLPAGDDDEQGSGDDQGDRPGRGRGHGHGPIRDLLDQLR